MGLTDGSRWLVPHKGNLFHNQLFITTAQPRELQKVKRKMYVRLQTITKGEGKMHVRLKKMWIAMNTILQFQDNGGL